ncbi:tail fiber protein [Paenibacillus alvei]|uniref:Tail fiber protein n=1 Tax=Paenibacillus alvei TaxID=44250 RepID=A0ABT4EA15_PAEAL|nr:tail fiber protein [Paenibacillus alvei]MCY9530576.1 tail fiber protein [Paenibacillus alvei]
MSRYPWRNTSEDISSQTPSQWETPGGAQKKADQAEQNAKTYTDQQMGAHVGKGGTAHANAVPNGLAGFITGEDKAKLDGVQAGANNYVHPATHPPTIIAQDANNMFVSDAEKTTWNAKATTDEATQSAKGLMSAIDKKKVDGIQDGAEVNQNAFSTLNTIAAANKMDKVTFVGGTGITITTDTSKKEIKVTATGNATPGPHAETHLPGGTDVIPFATSTIGGLMSDQDKKDLTATVTQLGQTTTNVNNHLADKVVHITASERSTWNSKANGSHTHDAADIVSGIISTVRLPVSSVSAMGIVQLTDVLNSSATNIAATANAVRRAYDEAVAAKTSGVEAKQRVVDAINAMGGSASTNDDWATLAAKIRAIQTGVKMAKGVTTAVEQATHPTHYVEVRGLAFRPQCIAIFNGFESRLYGDTTTYPGASGMNLYTLLQNDGSYYPYEWWIQDDGFRSQVHLRGYASSKDYNWVAFGG